MTCETVPAANTNSTSLAITKDDPIDANTEWLNLEPNDIGAFAATLEKTARDPISKDRQRRKGTITSLSAAPQFSADQVMDMVSYFIPGFLFTIWKGTQPESYSVVSVDGTTETYTVETGGAVLTAGTLVYGRGWAMPENNGLKTVASSTATTVVVNEDVVDETAPASARLYVVGVRGATGDLQIDANGDLISSVLDFTTLGLTVGQYIQIGGQAAANRFATAANFGKARIVSIAANLIELTATETTFVADTGTGQAVDLIFSAFARNVDVGTADFLKTFYTMEATYDTTPVLYEYAECCVNNTLAINNALQDKTTWDLGFVGTDVPAPVETPRAGTRVNQQRVEAFNTTADIVRLRVADADDAAVTTFFKDTNITINNNVAAEYVLAQLPAEYLNFGNIEVDIDTTVIFTDATVLAAIRNNTTLALEMDYTNDDGGFLLHFPSGTFGDGSKNFTRNERIKLTTPFAAEKDDVLEYTLGVSMFWYLPTPTAS